MTFLSLIVGFALGAGAIVFALQNNDVVALSFLGWQFESSLAVVIILATLTGLLLGILLSIPSIIRRSFTIMTLKREKQGLHNEAETLRHTHEEALARQTVVIDTAPPQVVDLRS